MEQYDLNLKTAARFWEHTVEFILDPRQWVAVVLPIPLNWNIVPFRENGIQNVPNDEVGVYSFVVQPDIVDHPNCVYLMYIGQTKNQSLRRRYQQYLRDQRTKKGRHLVVRMLNTWPDHLWFCYATIQQIQYIDEIEACLLSAYLPPINSEYPADVRGPMALWRS